MGRFIPRALWFVLDETAVVAYVALMGGPPKETARFLRSPALTGVETLHATFVVHRYCRHIHDGLTVAHVDRGAATFELDGERYVAPAGHSFLVPPHAVHTGEPAVDGGYSYRVLYPDVSRLYPGAAAS
jgi:hypothetical protein